MRVTRMGFIGSLTALLVACVTPAGQSSQTAGDPTATGNATGEPATTDPAPAPSPDPATQSGPAKTAAKAEQLAEDSTRQTTTGASFTAPKGWYLTVTADGVLLQDPDRELTLWQVDMAERDLGKAIAGAWQKVVPDFARKVRQSLSPPAQDGWDELRQIVYDVADKEKQAIMAVARRKGDITYVTLLAAPISTLSRRGAQMQQVVTSLKVAGQDKESFAGKTAHPLTGKRAAKFDAFIADALRQTGVPGAAVAVVQGGRITFEKGYGVRKLSARARVTPKTLFLIGSTTKPLTSLMMAKLVDEGKLKWTDPMSQLLPSFGLASRAIAERVQLKHSVCACTGLPRQDAEFIFEFANATPETRLAELRTMKPTTGFGETFQYSNPMVLAGGYAAAHAAYPRLPLVHAYDRVMREKVFKPLGMKATTFDHKGIRKKNHAWPHGRNMDNTFSPTALEVEHAVVSVAPAGGAWSTVGDLARYVQMELRKGKLANGKQYIGEKALLSRRERQVKITDELGYGLALFVGRESEIAVAHHGGNTVGFSGQTLFLPDHDVGLVILSNAQGANNLTGAIQRRLLELLFDGEERAAKNLALGLENQKKQLAVEMKRVSDPPNADWLKGLAGKYHNPALGPLELRLIGAGGEIDVGEWKSAVVEVKDVDGNSKLVTRDSPIAGVPLEVKGGKLVLDMGQQRYEFTRSKPATDR